MDSTENQDKIDQATIGRQGLASRRNLLRLLGVGGVVSAAAFAARPASAQDTTTTAASGSSAPGTTTAGGTTAGSTTAGGAGTPTTAPVPTTTPPPRAPTDSDRTLLAALKTVELTATEAYSALTEDRLTQLGYDEPTASVLAVLGPHHRAYGESLSGLFGPGLQVAANEAVFGALQADQLATGDAAAVLTTAQSIEDTLLDTYLTALDTVQSTDFAALVASILVVQARQSAVLAHLQGQPYDASSPAFEDGADALTLAQVAAGA